MDSNQQPSMYTKDQLKANAKVRMSNIYNLGWAFCFLVLGVKVAQTFSTSLLGNNGAISVAFLNYGCAIAYFFVPSILSYFKNVRIAMKVFCLEYGFYLMTYAYYIPVLNWIWSLVHGVAAATLWTCQVVFLAENSTDEDRGKKSGIFWGIYMIGSIVGNFFIFWFLQEYGITSTGNEVGWLGTVSILFLIFAICGFVGCIFVYIFKDPRSGLPDAEKRTEKKEKISNDLEETNSDEEKETKLNPTTTTTTTTTPTEKAPKVSFCIRFKKVFQDFFSGKYLITFFLTWFWGYQYAHANGLFNRQVVDRSVVGLLTSYSSVISVVFSFVSGYLIDKWGHYTVMVLTNLLMLLGLVVSYYADIYQNWLLYLAITFFSLADTGYQTIIPVIMTEYFVDAETVNAIFRFMECASMGIGYTIAPLFVEENETRTTLEMHLYEILICVVFLVLAQISYSMFIHYYGDDTVTNYYKRQNEKKSIELTAISCSNDSETKVSEGNSDQVNKNNQ